MDRWSILDMDRPKCKLERQWTVGTCCTWTGHSVSLNGNGPLEHIGHAHVTVYAGMAMDRWNTVTLEDGAIGIRYITNRQNVTAN